MAGMGVLHLEIATTMLQRQGLEIITSEPITNYRETIRQPAGPIMSKSPNRHNKIFMKVEPLAPDIVELIRKGELSDTTDKKTIVKLLRDHGWDSDTSRTVVEIDPKGNMLCEETKGVQFLQESMDTMRSGFEDVMTNGPLAYELCRGVKATLTHYVPHEDAAHRTYAQLMPATRRSVLGAMLLGNPTLLEPVLGIEVKGPSDQIGNITGVISGKRGKLINIEQREALTIVEGEIPAAETMDLSQEMRGATAGRAVWNTYFKLWQPVPTNMLAPLVAAIRKRKGLPEEAPKASEFIDNE
jgi:elongation factor 2